MSVGKGYDRSQLALGGRYLAGLDVPKNFKMAKYWFGKAAAQGNTLAKRFLKTLK
jgi:TPR repeat protein